MARIIQLYPKKLKPDQEAQDSLSRGFLPEDLERLRKRIMSDILRSFKSIVRGVLLGRYKEWMTAEQVQTTLNLSVKDLRKLSDSGQLPFEELCGDYYYDAKEVARAQKRQKRSKAR
ncbi:MAG TPA: hypothetical protein VF974_07330 [Patescibacteria group bacterium]